MVYQTKASVNTLVIEGFEALVYLQGNRMSPAESFPVTEECDWLRKIGQMTTEIIVAQVAEWSSVGLYPKPVSINISSIHSRNNGYFDFFVDMLYEYHVPPELVDIEIREHAIEDFSD
jgi:EAL domain-containing protein (putative c-di-GMP-specific phosphodiesterase class I)